MNIKMKILLTPLIAIIAFISCEDLGDPTIGPCVHIYRDPIVEVENVKDEQSGHIIYEFKIIEAVINDRTIEMHHLLNNVSFNSVIYDSILFCNTPCGFGYEEGVYKLSVSSIGYRDTTIIFNAQFKSGGGNCPSYSSGSTIVSFKMRKL